MSIYNSKTKKVLITGITGMVGSHLLDFYLENTNYEIYGLCRWRSPIENISHVIERANKGDRVYFEYADLNDYHSLYLSIKKIKPDYVFHLAAQSYPQTSFDSPIDTLNTNIIGTLNLLLVLREYGKAEFIHVCSSSEVFGRVPKEFIPIKENTKFHPASPYAISKVGTDLLGQYFAEAYGMNIVITRMFTHTGPRRGDVFAESSFAKQIALCENNENSNDILVGNLDSLRTFADVRDAVIAYAMLAEIKNIKGETYNIGGNHTCTVGEMLQKLISYSDKNLNIKIDKNRLRPIDADLQIPDISKFKGISGWVPKYTFDQTMKDLLDYWREKISKGNNFLIR